MSAPKCSCGKEATIQLRPHSCVVWNFCDECFKAKIVYECDGCETRENVVRRCVGMSYEYWCETCLKKECDHCSKVSDVLYTSGGDDMICGTCFDRYNRPIEEDESIENYVSRLPFRVPYMWDIQAGVEAILGKKEQYDDEEDDEMVRKVYMRDGKKVVLMKGFCEECDDYIEYIKGTKQLCGNHDPECRE